MQDLKRYWLPKKQYKGLLEGLIGTLCLTPRPILTHRFLLYELYVLFVLALSLNSHAPFTNTASEALLPALYHTALALLSLLDGNYVSVAY